MSKEQCTVSYLKKILDNLCNEGYGNMPIFLGEETPLLEDSICIDYLCNKGVHIKNTYYDKKLVDNANKFKNAIETAAKKYLKDCYDVGRYIKTDPDVVHAIWDPDRCRDGVFCPRCDTWMDDYNGQPDKCPNCGVRLEGWINMRDYL